MSPGRVLVPQAVSPAGIAVLHDAGLETVKLETTDVTLLQKAIADCVAVLVRTAPMSAEVLGSAADLKVVARHGAGVDNVDLDYCRSHGIRVAFAPEANTVSVAEHTLGLLLAASKNMRRCDAAVRRGEFGIRNTGYGIELEGKVLGIIGLGRIGRLVGKKAEAALGMRLYGFDPHVPDDQWPANVQRGSLEQLLEASDVVSVHVPLTTETRGLLGAPELARLKQGAYLVNAGRGGVVDEEALVEWLRTPGAGGAALDVYSHEPLGPDHPLTSLDNVLMTPHMAAHTAESLDRMAVHAAEGIVAILNGREPTWAVV